MSAPTTTDRAAVLIARGAFVEGWRQGCAANGMPTGHSIVECSEWAWKEAKRLYPLPTVTRPRVVRDPHDRELEYRVEDGAIVWRDPGEARPRWLDINVTAYSPWATTSERIKVWADLLANPTETVEDDGGAS